MSTTTSGRPQEASQHNTHYKLWGLLELPLPPTSGNAPRVGLSHRGNRQMLLFFFSLLLTDKTDAGRRDREIIYYYVVPSLPISQNTRETLNNFPHLVQIKELDRSRSKAYNVASTSEFCLFSNVVCDDEESR